MTRALRLSALAILLSSPTMPGAMQTAFAQSQDASQLGLQRTQPQPPAAPAASWNRAAAQELLRYIEGIGQEGLSPESYSPDRLRAA
ncbi:MAG TPA: hypothetical protein VLK25_07140, partial [Allosphingosinicella sp.]|nr:hypothetical protein [Allosphingosinicella sp.]